MTHDEKKSAILKILSLDIFCKPRISDANLQSRVEEKYPELVNDIAFHQGEFSKILTSLIEEERMIIYIPRISDGVWEYAINLDGDNFVKDLLLRESFIRTANRIKTNRALPIFYIMDRVLEWFSLNPDEFKGGLIIPRININGDQSGENMIEFYFPELNYPDFPFEIHLILKQLSDEGYLDRVSRGNLFSDLYSINFNGKYFSRNGGFQNKNELENLAKNHAERVERAMLANNKWTKVGTIVAAMATSCLVVVEILKNWKWINSIELMTFLFVFLAGLLSGITIILIIKEVLNRRNK